MDFLGGMIKGQARHAAFQALKDGGKKAQAHFSAPRIDESAIRPTGNWMLDEGCQLSHRAFVYFYNVSLGRFCAKVASNGTLSGEHGYLVWGVGIMVAAIAEAMLQNPNEATRKELDLAYRALNEHYNSGRKAYSAWITKDEDLYYDDNEHIINALITAYEATNDREYLQRAATVMRAFIFKGWNEKRGGVFWHVRRTDTMNACSTAPAGVAALRLACQDIQNREAMQEFGRKCIEWTVNTLKRPNGLIADNYHWDQKEKKFVVDPVQLSYNTGATIHGLCLLYKLTHDEKYIDQAMDMAEAAIDHNGNMFDKTVHDERNRLWKDNAGWIHHLVDGCVELVRALGREDANSRKGRVCARVREELAVQCRYAIEYLKDPSDGLYWFDWKLYVINQQTTDTFNRLTGQQQSLRPSGAERENQNGVDTKNRRMCKTLLGNASVAKILCAAGPVVDCNRCRPWCHA